jgi:hypothetical protein
MSDPTGRSSSLIAANVLSSVVGLLLLKELKNRLYCRLSASVTCLHILVQWLVLELLTLFDQVKRTDQLSLLRRLQLALLSTVAAIGSNSILVNNSVGLFQLAKFFSVFFQRSFFRFTKVELCARQLIVAGFALFAFSDPDADFFSIIVAIVASCSDGYYRCISRTLCKGLSLSAAEVRLSFIPYHYSMAVVVATLLDNTGEFSFAYAGLTRLHILMLFITSACSVGAFLSAPDGRALPIAENMAALLVLLLGYVCFPVEWESSAQMVHASLGAGMAATGTFMHLKAKRAGAKKSDPQKGWEGEL